MNGGKKIIAVVELNYYANRLKENTAIIFDILMIYWFLGNANKFPI